MPDHNDELASRLYRLLRQHDDWSDERLSEALAVSPDALSKAREELARMGLVRRVAGLDEQGARWLVVDPMLAVEQVMADQGRAIAEWSSTAGRLAADIESLVGMVPALRAAVDDAAMNTVLEGNETARAFLAELGGTVQRELLTVHSGGALPQEAIDAALPQDLAVLERGIEVRTIYLSSAVRSVPTRGYLERLAEAGASVRIRETLPFRMVLADGATAVCSMRWAEGRSGAIVVRGGAFVQLLRRMFDYCWAEATPLARAVGRVPDAAHAEQLDDEQLLMLRLLADGLTDQAIARQLGVAPRTFTRKLRALFEELGIESRFQAGVEAARRDLI
ncbi:helix-turn-helix domain-containing protein [Nocardioides speluncae]|uniref:helix-turn-helix domain-containing protein n=1 Tax=Nocardioides speluncae TaxID=2670337 RepID=UPI000D695867|nr:helix-turn-helix domain-containing protein [Nocardioides speluncae]